MTTSSQPIKQLPLLYRPLVEGLQQQADLKGFVPFPVFRTVICPKYHVSYQNSWIIMKELAAWGILQQIPFKGVRLLGLGNGSVIQERLA